MKTITSRVCVYVLSLVSVGLFAAESRAAGPATVRQAANQIQSTLTDASVSWRRCFRCGYGYGYGRGYGYGYYGNSYYGGWGYSRPMIYSYASYRRPVYYSGYSYGSPYVSSCNCGYAGYSNYQPMVYTASSYSYPSQSSVYGSSVYSMPTVYSSPVVYASPTYSSGTVYSPTYSPTATVYGTSGSGYYTPTLSSPTVISPPTPNAPSTYITPGSTTSAPYPNPPVEYSQPSTYRAPIASLSSQIAQSTNVPSTSGSLINVPSYSASFAYSGIRRAAYAPTSYGYNNSIGSPLVNRSGSNIVW